MVVTIGAGRQEEVASTNFPELARGKPHLSLVGPCALYDLLFRMIAYDEVPPCSFCCRRNHWRIGPLSTSTDAFLLATDRVRRLPPSRPCPGFWRQRPCRCLIPLLSSVDGVSSFLGVPFRHSLFWSLLVNGGMLTVTLTSVASVDSRVSLSQLV